MRLAKTAEAATAALQQERQKTAALTSELATVRRNFEATAASSTRAGDEATRLAKTAEAATAELQQERQKTAALTSELAAVRRNFEATAASSTRVGDETTRLTKTAEAATADLQQERKKTAVTSLRADEAHPEVDAAIRSDQSENSRNIPAKSTIIPTTSKQLTTSRSPSDPEAVRLMMRATGLLSQGNISEARIVLERAVEMGSAKASFAIAETYDPRVLSGWKTFGTRGDESKAREFYTKAAAGGIVEANDRLGSLPQ
jgi:TPR repeat protein